jgi:hypothetical protein
VRAVHKARRQPASDLERESGLAASARPEQSERADGIIGSGEGGDAGVNLSLTAERGGGGGRAAPRRVSTAMKRRNARWV